MRNGLDHDHNPLEDWLKNMSSQGEAEGEGTFSVAQDKAWEKLGAFQLPFESAWVLKLVQAAVAGGAYSIEVVQTRSQSTFRFPGVQRFCWNEVHKLLFEVDSQSNSASAHLAVGLRALAKSTGHPFLVNFQEDSKVIWNGEFFQMAESKENQFEFVVSHFVSHRVFQGIRFMAGVQKALADHCHLCPIPLTIDARPINSVANDPFCRPYSDCLPLGFLTAQETEELPALPLPETDWQSRIPEGLRAAFMIDNPFDQVQQACGAGLAVCGFRKIVVAGDHYFETYPKASELVWVCDGVVVARESLGVKRTTAVMAIVSASGLETDLTGFELRDTVWFRQRRKLALTLLAQSLSTARKQGLGIKGKQSVKSLLGWSGILLGTLVPPAGLAVLGIRWLVFKSVHAKQVIEFEAGLKPIEEALARGPKTRI